MIIKDGNAIKHHELPEEFVDVFVPAVPSLHQAVLDEVVLDLEDKATVKYRLAKVHLAAIICQYGEAPKEVGFFKVRSASNGFSEERVLVRHLHTHVSHKAYTWLEAVAAGLSSWSEAGFDDPLTIRWLNDTPTELLLNEAEDILTHQVNRFRLEYNERALARLMSFMSRVLPRL